MVTRVNKEVKQLRYFEQWAGSSYADNTWEPPEGLENAREDVKRFHSENPEMPGPNLAG